MEFTGELMFDRASYRKTILAISGKSKIISYRVLGLVIIVYGAISAYGLSVDSARNRPTPGSGVFLICLEILLGLYLLGAVDLAVARRWRKIAAVGGRKLLYEVSKEGIGIHSAHSDVEIRWEGIAKVRTEPDLWLITLGPGSKLTILRAAFTKIDAARLDTLFVQHQPVDQA